MDLHPRPEKIPAIGATVPLRGGITGRQLPEVMLLAPLPGGQPGDPGLMAVNGIGTLFHEFGRVMSFLLSVRPYVSSGGRPEEVDFLEVPSLMLEDFARQRAVLRRLSGHVQTGAPIPDDLLKRMQDAEALSRPMTVGRFLATSTLSLELHDRPADTVDPDALARRALAADMDVDLEAETHFPTAVEHFGRTEYSSNYYAFLRSEVIVKDLWSAFDPANPLDPRTARRYVDTILRPGVSRPAAESVPEFLGRPFNLASWRRWLEGDEPK